MTKFELYEIAASSDGYERTSFDFPRGLVETLEEIGGTGHLHPPEEYAQLIREGTNEAGNRKQRNRACRYYDDDNDDDDDGGP